MPCDAPPVPPQLEAQRRHCSEYSNPHTDKGQAVIEACKKVWDDYHAIRGEYDKCIQKERGVAK